MNFIVIFDKFEKFYSNVNFLLKIKGVVNYVFFFFLNYGIFFLRLGGRKVIIDNFI